MTATNETALVRFTSGMTFPDLPCTITQAQQAARGH